MELLTTNLATTALSGFWDENKDWAAFIACFVSAIAGVAISFFVFGSEITGTRLWALALVIAIVMMSISYGAKYGNAASRDNFTPLDLIQYVSQGFLWPATWPTLADRLGIDPIAPPTAPNPVSESGTPAVEGALDLTTRLLGLLV